MAKWLVTGAAGMLGVDLVGVLRDRDEIVTACARSELDITDAASVDSAIGGHDVVVNLAAWTAVDDAEAHETEATLVNGTGANHLARACARSGARMVQVSTDYVFPGNAIEPYDEAAPSDPINAYGRSKWAGEVAVQNVLPTTGYIMRTAWLYGEHGSNFVTTMARLARDRPTLSVVDDQLGQPTWTVDVAKKILAVIDRRAPAGIYHATSSGQTTWFGLARAVFEELDLDPDRVQATTSAAYVRPAARPAYSVLGHRNWRRAGIEPIQPWRDALRQAAPTMLGQYR